MRFRRGTLITDGLVKAVILSQGCLRVGKRGQRGPELCGYKVEIVTPVRERGHRSFITYAEARKAKR